jgi:hypothetical protein
LPQKNEAAMKELLFISALFIPAIAFAQGYAINWYKVSDGGGVSAGGGYQLSGTIGQPDAGGPLAGSGYSATGGFWAIYAVQARGAPILTIVQAQPNMAVISWPAPSTGFALESTSNLQTPHWVAVTNAVNIVNGQNQVTISPPSGVQYYRLHNP